MRKTKVKSVVTAVVVLVCFLVTTLCMSGLTASAAGVAPSNPNASQGAKNLLSYLNGLSGNHIIAGHLNYADAASNLVYYDNYDYGKTGKHPGLYGTDWSYWNDNPYGFRSIWDQFQGVVDACKVKSQEGAVIQLMWHMPRPDFDINTAGWGEVHGIGVSDAEGIDMITPGTASYNRLIARIDAIVPYLQQLRDAGVTVIWRPFHEMNYGYFWWGAYPTFVKGLWTIMYDRYTNVHGLNNLLWNWNVSAKWDTSNTSDFANYYPGSQYVDIVSVDSYRGSTTDFPKSEYDELHAVDTTKPCALGENSHVPDPDYLFSNGMNYTYYMIWGNLVGDVSDNELSTSFNHSKVYTRDEINIPVAPTSTPGPTPTPIPNLIPQSQMSATATSNHAGYEPSKAIDNNTATMWHTEWTPMAALPQSITINLGGTYDVNTLTYLPGQDGGMNGIISQYKIYASTDGINFTSIATGNWASDATMKTATFTSARASYIRLEALQGYGGYANAAEINIAGTSVNSTNFIPQSQMSVTATSNHAGYEPSKAIDNNTATMWHTEWTPMAVLPQSITINLGGTYDVNTLTYLPGQDGGMNGIISQYKIYASTNGTTFTSIATGNWASDATKKTATFTSARASYIRLEAIQGYGGYANAAEINIAGTSATGNIASQGTITASVTSPNGGGNHNIEIIRDGVKPAVGNSDSNLQYDTFNGNAGPADQYYGYTFSGNKTFTKLVFQEGKHFTDGGWFKNGTLKVQVRQNGTWNNVSASVSPAYPNSDSQSAFGQSFETYTFTLNSIVGDGIRIYGTVGGSARFISIGELEAWAN